MFDIDTNKQITFNAYKTLCVIEQDSMICDIFRDENKLEFSLLKTMALQGVMNPDTEAFLKDLFEKIILERRLTIEMYLAVIEPQIATPVVPSPVKKEKALPRRYGKEKIQADIDEQGGKPTEAQLAGLRINDLKNIYVSLEARIIKTLLSEDKVLTEEDCRTIKATIDTVEKKLEVILKKKK